MGVSGYYPSKVISFIRARDWLMEVVCLIHHSFGILTLNHLHEYFPMVWELSNVFPTDLLGVFGVGHQTHLYSSLLYGFNWVEGIERSVVVFLLSNGFIHHSFSMGCFRVFCEEEGWIHEDVYWLSIVEQSGSEEQIFSSLYWWFVGFASG